MDSLKPVQIDIAAATELYVTAKRGADELALRHKEELAIYENAMEEAKAAIQTYLLQNKSKSIKTDAGTVTLMIENKVYIHDQVTFINWVKENKQVELLQMRLAKNHVLEYAEENDNKLPDGVSKSSSYAVRVTPSR